MSTEELAPEELSALLSSYMPELPGYRVMRRIGRGGMSYVYLGVQVSLDRQVAIKVMAPEAMADEKSKQRFEQEARTIAKLEHPCIVGIHEVGRSPQGLMYYVLPYLAKGHLGQRDFTNDEARATEVLRALLSALEYAHARGIVHRDVKAENVLFDNADRPLLTDFGIALAKRDTTRITTAGLAVGSGGYMAPEQARGEAVDGRADLYSVGVLAFELLTGHLPYMSGDQLGLALMHAQDPIPRLPPEKKHWQSFIDRAMAKSPDNRYRNAQQMLSALNQAAGKERPSPIPSPSPVVEPSASVYTPTRRPAPARRVIPNWVLIGVPAAALLLVAFFALRPHSPEAPKKTDFFTTQDADKATPVVTAVPAPNENPAASVPAISTPPEVTATPAPPAPSPATTATASVPATTEIASPAPMFAKVSAQVTVTPLDYDPTQPGAHELSVAQRQLKQKRLSTPPGDNAADSLLAAHKAAPANPDVTAMSDKLISAFAGNIADAIRANHDDSAKTTYQRAAKFAKQISRGNGPAWLALHASLPPLLMARLDKSAQAMDSTAIAKAKTLALALELTQAELEPSWSRASVVPKLPNPGDLLKSEGPAMVLVTVPSESRTGLAVMREEVTRGEYAGFVAATHRPASKCGNALQAFFGSKHNWSDPGIAQTNAHPVVCVSQADARAYASWMNSRNGQHYRLPTSLEWRAIVDYRGGDPCRSGQINCGNQHGTAPGSEFAPSPLGIQDLHGNVSEWLADSAGGDRYLVGGLSWRDTPGTSPLRTDGRNGDRGADDIGFRLVRDVALKDVVSP
jgi:serine/threonine protein kinase